MFLSDGSREQKLLIYALAMHVMNEMEKKSWSGFFYILYLFHCQKHLSTTFWSIFFLKFLKGKSSHDLQSKW